MNVFVAGLRRFFVVLLLAAAVAALAGLAIGAVWDFALTRALALGFYIVGSLLLIGGFFVGNRGPVRASREGGVPLFGSRFVRWATREELDESINASAVYVTLGVALILLGIAAESS